MKASTTTIMACLFVVGLLVSSAAAVNIDMVTVGNPGNAGEWSGKTYGGRGPDRICGEVDYTSKMGKFEVTAGQYCAFLNAVAGTDTYGLYSTYMANIANCNIQRGGSGTQTDPYVYSVASGWTNRPVNYVSWGDAVRFANWLTNGQPTGPQNASTTEDGSYYLNGAMTDADLLAVTRKPNATWVIPSEDEWYKAAFHKNDGVTGNYWDYPTSGNAINTGMANYDWSVGHTTDVGTYGSYPSPYGTFDQGGNVWEWNEAVFYGSYRGLRGGAFGNCDGGSRLLAAYRYDGLNPSYEDDGGGFRVAEVPEPGSAGLFLLGGLLVARRRRALR